MPANHVEYSKELSKIKSLLELSTQASTDSQKFYTLEEQEEAKDLATFLMHSTLTTPNLDRKHVSELLNGTQLWEQNGKPVSISKGIGIEYLEECNLVMFEADWLLLTCNLEVNLEQKVDDSLVPVVETLRTLKWIQRGLEGYKKPNLSIPDEIWNREFTSTSPLLAYVEREGSSYVFNGRNHNLNQLVSTFLWQKLFVNSVNSKEAFERWLRIMRLTSSEALPVLKYVTSETEYNTYTSELQKHLSEIPSPVNLTRSISNYNRFSEEVRNYSQTLTVSIEFSSTKGKANSTNKCTKQSRQNMVTKDSLPSLSSHSLHQVTKNRFSAIQEHLKSRTHLEGPGNFYCWLISDFLEKKIHIERYSISYPSTLIKLLELSLKHDFLEYMFFCGLFKFQLPPKYFCLLLSRIETCNYAIFWFSHYYRDLLSHIEDQGIIEALEVSISKQYAKTNTSCNKDFFDVFLILIDKLEPYRKDPKDSPHYRLFNNFLKHQEPKKILSIIDSIEEKELCEHAYPIPENFKIHNNTYFLLWWLYDFIDINHLDTDQVYLFKIVQLVMNELERDIKFNIEGKKSNLNASNLINQFPWHKLVTEDNVKRLLSISTKYRTDWSPALWWTNKSQFSAKGAISCYFQILMTIANHDSCKHLSQLHKRNMSIAGYLGFNNKERDGLFNNIEINTYKLWPDFCIYTNKFDQSDFEEFLHTNADTLTYSQLFQLMECCIHPARKKLIKSSIENLSLKKIATSSLNDLEKTFISAYQYSDFDLAKNVIEQASNELNTGRFKNQNNSVFNDKRKLVRCYQYKLDVTLLAINQGEYDPDFESRVNQVPIPFMPTENKFHNECEHFRRYYLAYYLIKHNITKSILILERLVNDSDNPEFILMMLHVYLANHHETSNITLIQNTLAKVEQSAEKQWSVIPNYPLSWISEILQTYLTIDDITSMKKVWNLLSSAQKVLPQLLTPYCKLLAKHRLVKEADIALSAYMSFLGKNEDLPEELDKVYRTIVDALATNSSVTKYFDHATEKNQRSPEQLASAFKQINGSSAEEYVRITSNSSIEEYLVQAVTAVSRELLSRSKSLYIPYKDNTSTTGLSSRPANEDRINQWFCSLFNMREKNSPLNFYDQSQIGSSASGNGPGEVDGVIADSHQNKRIALFEAFRLIHWSTTPINEHMDKLAGYDREGFNTVFVVVYAFDKNFITLLRKYKSHISERDHVDYTKVNDYSLETVNGEDSDTLWMGKEQRMRGNTTVSIYHIVINFNCDEEDPTP